MSEAIPENAEIEPLLYPPDWRIAHWLHENRLSLSFAIAEQDDDLLEGEFSYSGFITFEGCINWSTSSQCMAHLCEPDDLNKLKAAFQEVTKLAAKRVQSWCG